MSLGSKERMISGRAVSSTPLKTFFLHNGISLANNSSVASHRSGNKNIQVKLRGHDVSFVIRHGK